MYNFILGTFFGSGFITLLVSDSPYVIATSVTTMACSTVIALTLHNKSKKEKQNG